MVKLRRFWLFLDIHAILHRAFDIYALKYEALSQSGIFQALLEWSNFLCTDELSVLFFANQKWKADLICRFVKPRVNAKTIFSSSVVLGGNLIVERFKVSTINARLLFRIWNTQSSQKNGRMKIIYLYNFESKNVLITSA